jgi:hypothetical protein
MPWTNAHVFITKIAKGTTMAKHDVSFSIPERSLGKSDVEFVVKQDGSVLGRLDISNGSVVWFPKGKSYGYKMVWGMFDDLMKREATRLEKR